MRVEDKSPIIHALQQNDPRRRLPLPDAVASDMAFTMGNSSAHGFVEPGTELRNGIDCDIALVEAFAHIFLTEQSKVHRGRHRDYGWCVTLTDLWNEGSVRLAIFRQRDELGLAGNRRELAGTPALRRRIDAFFELATKFHQMKRSLSNGAPPRSMSRAALCVTTRAGAFPAATAR